MADDPSSIDGLAALDVAARLFRQIGNQPAADHVAAERARFAARAAQSPA
ncbi:MAG: hypothetical protein KGQ52_09040 [Alphaproteobacteria bacterium]|nr:hypothetical protein [Alphaproteobacteria bacterium]